MEFDWQYHIDSVFFIYGLSFLLLAVILYARGRSYVRLPWNLLALFGLLHGLNEWLDMAAMSRGDTAGFLFCRTIVMAVSFIPLLEFGRKGLQMQNARVPGRWIYIPLILTGVCGYYDGINGMNAAFRYALGLPGALTAAAVLLREFALRKLHFRWPLALMGFSFLIYGLTTGLVVPKAAFFPANVLHVKAFLSFMGFPVQIVRAFMALLSAIGAWTLFRFSRAENNMSKQHAWMIAVLFVTVITSGLWVVEWKGRMTAEDIRGDLLDKAIIIARTIDPQVIKKFTFTTEDYDDPQFERLRGQMVAFGKLTGVTSVYSMVIRKGNIVFGPENIPASSPLASDPGTIYEQPRPGDWDVFRTGEPYTVGPATDEFGTFVSAGAPVKDYHTGEVVMVVALDMMAEEFSARVASARFNVIMVLVAFMGILLISYGLLSWREWLPADQAKKLRYLEPCIAATIGVLITIVMVMLAYYEQGRNLRMEFMKVIREQTGDVVEALQELQSSELNSLARFVEASNEVTREEFQVFTGPLAERSMARSWGWISVESDEDETPGDNNLFSGKGGNGLPAEDNSKDALPEARPATRYPVHYIEPPAFSDYIGFDFSTEPFALDVITEALVTRLPSISDPFYLPPGEKILGLLAVRPVIKGRYVNADIVDGHAGLAFTVLDLGSFVNKITDDMDQSFHKLADVDFYYLPENGDPVWLGSPDNVDEGIFSDGRKKEEYISPIFMFGKAYAVVARPRPEAVEPSLYVSVLFGLIGLSLTACLGVLVAFITRRKVALEEEVETRTKELRENEKRLVTLTKNLEIERVLLEQSQIRFNQIAEQARDVIWEVDAKGYFVYVSSAVKAMFGYEPESVMGMHFVEFLDPQGRQEVQEKLNYVMMNKETLTNMELRCMTCFGTVMWVLINASPVIDDQGRLVSYRGSTHDITEHKTIEETLLMAKRKAEAADRAKSVFLANMSHEIRTPLNAIIGFSELLRMTNIDERQSDFLNNILSSSHSLISIISDILDFSKIEAGKISLEAIPFRLDYLLKDSLMTIMPRIEKDKISTWMSIAPDVPQDLIGDPTRLRQIILNLLGNAVKFTQRGEIGIDAEVEGMDEGTVRLRIAVSDTGIGIAADKLEDIFRPFNQADMSTTRKYGGTGLGLTISQSMAKCMGGHITVRSEEGKGSSFIFSLPLRIDKAPRKEGAVFDLALLQGKKAVIIDDHEKNIELFTLSCERLGIKVIAGFTSAKAVKERLKEKIAGEAAPDFLLCDIRMSEEDGYDLVTEIHSWPELRGAKFIAVTSDLWPGAAQFAQEKGFHGFLPKPFVFSELAMVLMRISGQTEDGAGIMTRHRAKEDGQSRELAGTRVLIVEDKAVNQELIQLYLEMWGCECGLAVNGQDALDKLRREKFHMILMDIQMPVMGGIEATRAIREELGLKVPVIALTAAALKEDKEAGLAAGMDDYLTKPINPELLHDILMKYRLSVDA